MGSFHRYCLCLLLVVMVIEAHVCSRGVDARPLSLLHKQNYVNMLGSLGMECTCCDSAGGGCRSTWEGSCKKLDCRPWKQPLPKIQPLVV
ncbi:hypothetical protein QJS10_CPA03g01763 [Acorus calamus]|uniref:Uncharacterized protein n=1 Tax=Acorus calamus TaxID=4465 RepID=A0AAV9F8C6_ACOCL|nr:hypothetical protein QJS10_CPA03g01763 [Acorus calamus]